MARAAAASARNAAPARRATRPTGRSTKQVRRTARRASPRRLSAPATRRPALAAAAGALPLLRSPLARGAWLRGGRVLDALLAGRGWIALVFVLLAGIVFFNVDLLQLNRDIAATAEKASELRRSNAALRLELATLGSSERIQREAAEAGFVLPAPGDVVYLSTSRRDASRAAKLITAPDPAAVIPPPAPAEIVEEPVADPMATDPAATDPAATTDPAVTDPATAETPVAPSPELAPPATDTGAVTAPPAG